MMKLAGMLSLTYLRPSLFSGAQIAVKVENVRPVPKGEESNYLLISSLPTYLHKMFSITKIIAKNTIAHENKP